MAAAMHAGGRRRNGWDPDIGTQLMALFRDRGLVELDVRGQTRTMRGGDYTSQWWYLGMETAAPLLVREGVVTQGQIDSALDMMRSPDFRMMSPLSITMIGRVRP